MNENVEMLMQYAMKYTKNGGNIIVYDSSVGTKSNVPKITYIEKIDDQMVILFENDAKKIVTWQDAAARINNMNWAKSHFIDKWTKIEEENNMSK